MHELSLCQHILAIINQQMTERKPIRVKKICLEVGSLTGVDEAALRFAFEIAAKETIASGAMLDIVSIPGEGVCPNCQQSSLMQHYFDACKHCGEYGLSITAGEQLTVKSMEIS